MLILIPRFFLWSVTISEPLEAGSIIVDENQNNSSITWCIIYYLLSVVFSSTQQSLFVVLSSADYPIHDTYLITNIDLRPSGERDAAPWLERSLMVRWSSDRSFMVDPLSYVSFQPVLHNWCRAFA